jgi:aryl-alcohol dehydrogenase-like predicted oxidoreductase
VSASATSTRRSLLLAGGALVLAGAVAAMHKYRELQRTAYSRERAVPAEPPRTTGTIGRMPLRAFGATGLQVSEVAFGAWAIGGRAYGNVDSDESLRALARAEELGCNLVDTALVYGDSELVLGRFLRDRRSRWIVATKYSFQSAGMTATLEAQLKRLQIEAVDFYQLHSPPPTHDTYEELFRLKRAGKVRFVGASVYSARNIDEAIEVGLDGVQVPFSLLDPYPFELRRARLRQAGLAVLIRSALREGFLAGKFTRDSKFPDPNDQRHDWSRARIAQTVEAVEHFRFLESAAGPMVRAAIAYPLSFPEVSTVLLGTKNTAQASTNFGDIPGARLDAASLERILALQEELDVGQQRNLRATARRLLDHA